MLFYLLQYYLLMHSLYSPKVDHFIHLEKRTHTAHTDYIKRHQRFPVWPMYEYYIFFKSDHSVTGRDQLYHPHLSNVLEQQPCMAPGDYK